MGFFDRRALRKYSREADKVLAFESTMAALSDDELKTRMDEFKKSFGRKKKPTILTISAAGHIGIENLIDTIEKQMIGME